MPSAAETAVTAEPPSSPKLQAACSGESSVPAEAALELDAVRVHRHVGDADAGAEDARDDDEHGERRRERRRGERTGAEEQSRGGGSAAATPGAHPARERQRRASP